MAPKKKTKRDSFGASSMAAVPKFLQETKNFIVHLYSLRHCKPGDAQDLPHPFLHGGTFKDFAQRIWEQPEALILDTMKLLKKVKHIDSGMTVEEFGEQFLRVKVVIRT